MTAETPAASTGSHTAGDPLVDALGQTTFVLVTALNRLAAEHDLSLTQLRVMGILTDRGRVRVSRLADHLGLEKSTLTGLVDRGVRRGLLAREPSPGDGRAVDVLLTPAGAALADRLYRSFATEVDRLAAGLGAAERTRLAALCRRFLETAPPTARPSHDASAGGREPTAPSAAG